MGWATSLGRASFNSPEWVGSSSPVETEPLQIVLSSVSVKRSGASRCDATQQRDHHNQHLLVPPEPAPQQSRSSPLFGRSVAASPGDELQLGFDLKLPRADNWQLLKPVVVVGGGWLVVGCWLLVVGCCRCCCCCCCCCFALP